MKIFLPPLDTVWRLAADWTPPDTFLKGYHNQQTLWDEGHRGEIEKWLKATGESIAGPDNFWVKRFHAWQADRRAARGTPQFLKGTVFSLERYHVSRSGEDQITIKILASPCPLLTPRKLKGKMTGPGRLYFSLDDFNTLPELEEANDVRN